MLSPEKVEVFTQLRPQWQLLLSRDTRSEFLLLLTFPPASGGFIRSHLTCGYRQRRAKRLLEFFVVQNRTESC